MEPVNGWPCSNPGRGSRKHIRHPTEEKNQILLRSELQTELGNLAMTNILGEGLLGTQKRR